ncbi:MAG: enoyl-CoA hydratase/isomerase family protein [Pseudomonadales bacterium]
MTAPDFQYLRLAATGGVSTLTFHRPEMRNALNEQMMVEIGQAVEYLRRLPDARVVVVRGAGGHFCAGGDLNTMRDPPAPGLDGSDPAKARYRAFGDVLGRLNRLPQAVIAVVEGTCVGGGFGMAACADVVIAGESARFGLPEPRHGFIPSQIIPFLVRRLGEAAVRRIAVTASVVGAREAYRLGMVDVLVADADIELALARELTNLHRAAPRAVAAVKNLVVESTEQPLDRVLDHGATALMELLRGAEAAEGISAFLAKRPPGWERR